MTRRMVAQLTRAPDPSALAYLVGGDHRDVETAEFPKFRRRMVRDGDRVDVYDVSAARPFGPED